MEKHFFIKVNDKQIKIIEGRRYRCVFRNNDPVLIGAVIPNMYFDYDSNFYFCLLCDDGEDYQIADYELLEIEELPN